MCVVLCVFVFSTLFSLLQRRQVTPNPQIHDHRQRREEKDHVLVTSALQERVVCYMLCCMCVVNPILLTTEETGDPRSKTATRGKGRTVLSSASHDIEGGKWKKRERTFQQYKEDICQILKLVLYKSYVIEHLPLIIFFNTRQKTGKPTPKLGVCQPQNAICAYVWSNSSKTETPLECIPKPFARSLMV